MNANQRYYVIPDTGDDCDIPTQPEPMKLSAVSDHIRDWLKRYDEQGYYRNARMEEVPLHCIGFLLNPE